MWIMLLKSRLSVPVRSFTHSPSNNHTSNSKMTHRRQARVYIPSVDCTRGMWSPSGQWCTVRLSARPVHTSNTAQRATVLSQPDLYIIIYQKEITDDYTELSSAAAVILLLLRGCLASLSIISWHTSSVRHPKHHGRPSRSLNFTPSRDREHLQHLKHY